MKKNTKIVSLVFSLGALLLPAIAMAQSFTYIDNWFNEAQKYLNLSITIITVLMTVFFLYNVAMLVLNKDAGKAKELKGKVWNGLIGLFISVAVWGIINLAASIIGVPTGNGAASLVQETCPPGFAYNQVSGTCTH